MRRRVDQPAYAVIRNVQVRGSAIARVVFRLDSRRVKTLTRPNRAKAYALRISPLQQRHGTHRVTATTTFKKSSHTPTRTLRVAYQRCAKSAVLPAFTG